MCFKSSVFQIFRNNFYNVKHCSTKSLYYNPTYKRQNLTHFDFKPKFKDEDQGKILNILNNSTKDELRRLNVSQSGIQILEAYRSKNGPFQSLQDLLGVDGLSLNMLEKLCGQIIVDTPGKFTHKIINKRSKNFLTPNLPTEKIPVFVSESHCQSLTEGYTLFKSPVPESIDLNAAPLAYSEKLAIKPKKYDSIMPLAKKYIPPAYYHPFYEDLKKQDEENHDSD